MTNVEIAHTIQDRRDKLKRAQRRRKNTDVYTIHGIDNSNNSKASSVIQKRRPNGNRNIVNNKRERNRTTRDNNNNNTKNKHNKTHIVIRIVRIIAEATDISVL